MSILNSLKGMVSNELVSGLAGHLGESNDGIGKAMGGILPSLLGGLLNTKQEDQSMLSGLLSQAGNLGENNLVGDLLGGLTDGNSNSGGIGSIGSSLVSGLLGNKMGGVVELLSKFAGVKSGSSSSLLSIGGSLLASFLGKKMLSGGLNFSSLLNMIGGEKAEIAKAMPEGFSSALGLGNLFGDVSADVSKTVSNVANTASNAGASLSGGSDDSNSGGGMKWLWPLVLLGVLAAGIMWFMKGCNKTDGETSAGTEQVDGNAPVNDTTRTEPTTSSTTTSTTTDTTVANSSTTATTTTTVAESKEFKLINGTKINAFKGGVEDKLVAFLSDPNAKVSADKKANWFDFDNLNFDLGKSTITKASMVQIENLAAILKAYPNLKIKVGGYTDKKGDDAGNLKLSQSRANAVFTALKAKGANPAQLIAAEGYGETLATVAETASDEERRKDRRTAVRVDAK